MIPETLRLRNYLSHRETEVDFKGLNLAVLVGPNGAGKSSLLDALAWAVWGESRVAHGQEDALYHHGEDFVEVELVFRLPYRDGTEQRYRILRRRESKGRRSSQTLLDFQVEGERGWVSLNGNSTRETQRRIYNQLHLDYATFINSAYLRQGRADEFLALDPAERKRILGTILGLERWERYREAARDRLSAVKARTEELEARLKEWEADVKRRPQLQQALMQAQQTLEQASAQLKAAEERITELTRTQERARALDAALKDLSQRQQEAQTRLENLQAQIAQAQARHEACAALIANAESIAADYAAYQAALEEERAWNERLSQSAQLQEAIHTHERAITQAREALQQRLREQEQQAYQLEKRIENECAQLEKALSDLEGQIRALSSRQQARPSVQTVEEAEKELLHLQELQARFEAAQATLLARREEDVQLRERNNQLKASMKEKKQSLELLAESAICPLCRQPLSDAHRSDITAQLTAEGKALGDEYRTNQARRKAIEEELRELQSFLDQSDPQLRKRSALEQHVARLREQLAQAERDRAEQERIEAEAAALRQRIANAEYAQADREALQRIQQSCVALREQLANEDYGHEARAALAALAEDLRALGYDASAHEAARGRVRTLKAAETRMRELENARVEISAIAAALERLAQEQAQVRGVMEALANEARQRAEERAALQSALDEAPRLLQARERARQQENAARAEVQRLNMELSALDTLEKRLKEGHAELTTLKQRQVILNELRDAFSVQGIPALIIERVLPQLEHDTNSLLERLTHGQMTVQFRTQKELKGGGTRETLELLISDARGTRPYSLFSGGEQFRINFAVRVALSRLLAQRAGVRLRTLFIDEGFGVLDTDGRDRLVEAIRVIQHEFDLILVITHIEELQEAFPARIVVTKDEQGSHVEVI